jgi:hypothetical protein
LSAQAAKGSNAVNERLLGGRSDAGGTTSPISPKSSTILAKRGLHGARRFIAEKSKIRQMCKQAALLMQLGAE